MKKTSFLSCLILLSIWLMIVACNLSTINNQDDSKATDTPYVITATFVTNTVQPTQETPMNEPSATATETPTVTPTQCEASLSTSTNVNARSGPGTDYPIVGSIPAGGKAMVFGQNTSRSWWYIEFPSGSGQFAWISADVTTPSCIPNDLQVVNAAPPPPTATFTPTVVLLPDLVITVYNWSPIPAKMNNPINVYIEVRNEGDGDAGAYKVTWWASVKAPTPKCIWDSGSLGAHQTAVFKCSYTPQGWGSYTSQLVVDAGGKVSESNEYNNVLEKPLEIIP